MNIIVSRRFFGRSVAINSGGYLIDGLGTRVRSKGGECTVATSFFRGQSSGEGRVLAGRGSTALVKHGEQPQQDQGGKGEGAGAGAVDACERRVRDVQMGRGVGAHAHLRRGDRPALPSPGPTHQQQRRVPHLLHELRGRSESHDVLRRALVQRVPAAGAAAAPRSRSVHVPFLQPRGLRHRVPRPVNGAGAPRGECGGTEDRRRADQGAAGAPGIARLTRAGDGVRKRPR